MVLQDEHYQALAEFRYQLRRFLRRSEDAARAVGLEPQQHQLLLAIRGLPPGYEPTIGELAERLQVQHHSAVELIDRLEQRGLVRRERSQRDRRQVYVRLTPDGERLLEELSAFHWQELQETAPRLIAALSRIADWAHSEIS
jgi:DNA-binding MarR family transcriptional regulator